MGKSGQEALQERFKTIFGPSGAPLGEASGRQNEPKSAQVVPKRRPRACQERFGRHLVSKSVLISIFYRFFIDFGMV